MSIRFNTLLADEGVDPSDVCLLRHQTKVMGNTPYNLWCDSVDTFVQYLSTQTSAKNWQTRFKRPYWANFVVHPSKGTLFVGLYEATLVGPLKDGTIDPLSKKPIVKKRRPNEYKCQPLNGLSKYIERLSIHWGAGSWAQLANKQDKEIMEELQYTV